MPSKLRILLLIYLLPSVSGLFSALILGASYKFHGVQVQLEPVIYDVPAKFLLVAAGIASSYFGYSLLKGRKIIKYILPVPLLFWGAFHAMAVQGELLSNWGYGCCRFTTASWVGITESVINPLFPVYSWSYKEGEM